MFPILRPLLRIPLLLLLASAALSLAACCTTPSQKDFTKIPLPAELEIQGPIVASVHAKGVQIYTCKANASGALSWMLTRPEATFDDSKGLMGKHYASTGPTWEADGDHSIVVGEMQHNPAPDPDAIPWLRLIAVDHKGSGIFSDVTYIQRIHTTNGKAPALGNAKSGDEIRVPYTADYVFYGKGAHPTLP